MNKFNGFHLRHAYLCPFFLGMVPCLTLAAGEESIWVVADGSSSGNVPQGYAAQQAEVATKTRSPLVDVPQFVSVVNRQQMDVQSADTVSQALRYSAGVAVERFGAFSSGVDFARMRGFEADYYLDGLRVIGNTGIWGPQIETWGLQSVEVLHGPSFVDMSIGLMNNSAKSIAIMGQLFDNPQSADSLIRFRQRHLDTILDTLAKRAPPRPRVMMERAAGLYDDCCLSWGNGNYGEMVNIAGGFNLAQRHIHGVYGSLSQETVIASRPDKIVVTGSNWSHYSPGGDWVNLGPGADLALAKTRLEKLMRRPAYHTLAAAKSGKAYAIWHPFYDHPFNFVAIERLATWFHPSLFAGVDPEATFAELFARFLPIPYQPGYWVSLDAEP